MENLPIILDLSNLTCHSGGAMGADTYFEKKSIEFGVQVRAYSYKTKYHNSVNKFEISEADYLEGIEKIKIANKSLRRYGISKYMNLLARNWAQVKYSNQIIAISKILNPGDKTDKGVCRSIGQSVAGGTAYACQMAIDNMKPLYVFDQDIKSWFRYSYTLHRFVETECPSIQYQDFSGIGTRNLNESGELAIEQVFEKTFVTKNVS